MPALLDRFGVFNRAIARYSLWLSAFGLVVMTVVIGWQIWARYVLNDTPHWSERLSLFLMIYYILFAAAAGTREGFHLGLVIFKELLPPMGRRMVEVLINLAVGVFGGFMIWYGAEMAVSTWSHTIPTLGISTGFSYLPFPLAGVLIVLFSVEHVLDALVEPQGVPE